MKTPEQYLTEAETAHPWAFLNKRGCALRAIAAAIADSQKPPRKAARPTSPQQPTLFPTA